MKVVIRYPDRPSQTAHTLRKAGQGAFAVCYRVDPSLVVKLYRQPPQGLPEAYLRRKLTTMAAVPPPYCNEASFIAWPVATVHHQETGRLTGYLMPAMPKGYRPLFNRRNSAAPGWQRAIAQAGHTLKALYQAGIVVGDINGSNLQCNADGQLALLDCDGWQVQVNGKLYYAQSGTERLTCPRLIAQYRDHPSLCHNRNCPEYGAQHPRDIGFDPRTPDHGAAQNLRRNAGLGRRTRGSPGTRHHRD